MAKPANKQKHPLPWKVVRFSVRPPLFWVADFDGAFVVGQLDRETALRIVHAVNSYPGDCE